MSVDPVDGEIGLDDGDKVVLLADADVASQAVCGLVDDVVGRGVVCHVDVEGRVPLGELGPMGIVGGVKELLWQGHVNDVNVVLELDHGRMAASASVTLMTASCASSSFKLISVEQE